MSDWVPEAQRIAKEATEKARKEVTEQANVAMGWLIQNAPTAAQHVLEAIVWRRPTPSHAEQMAFACGDWKRNDVTSNAMALNDRLAEARDAALEEAATALEKVGFGAEHSVWLAAVTHAERIRALKGRK